MSNRFVVIMAGGKGERFWPASRLACPKHLLPIVGDKPMLTQTIERIGALLPPENVIVITNAEQVEGVRKVCPTLPPENIVVEPVGRDTAPAVGLAMLLVKARDEKASLAMLPADAFIEDEGAFQSVLEAAFRVAEGSLCLVTIGIQPTMPATGYGYIHRGPSEAVVGNRDIYSVLRFKEKPDLELAKGYVQSGEYFWNAGMFVWSVASIDDALTRHAPGLRAGLGRIEAGLAAGRSLADLLAEHYPELEKISIDFAIMEKADNVKTLAATFDWDDVGSWPAVGRHFPSDTAGNVRNGPAKFLDSSNNIAVSDAGHLIALVGVKDLIVVHTGDATLVCHRDQAEQIKAMVKQLGADAACRHLI